MITNVLILYIQMINIDAKTVYKMHAYVNAIDTVHMQMLLKLCM